jgi:cytoskeletal protein CcmA (bactofilin family)/uncharacterized Tic20 family protein
VIRPGWSSTRRRVLAASAGAVLAAGSAVALGAESLDGRFRTGESVTVAADETIAGDLYVAAATVFVVGTVQGDLVALGGDVSVAGSVEGDVVVAAGTVRISGEVEGDVRAAVGDATVTGLVGEDLAVASGQVTVAASGAVAGDVIVGAGQLTLAGSVGGNLEGSVGTYAVTGTVAGIENVVVERAEGAAEVNALDRVLDAARHYLIVVLIGALALWALPRMTRAAADTVRARPLPSLGVGLLAAMSTLVAAVLIAIGMVVASLLLGLIGFDELGVLVVFAAFVALLALALAVWLVAGYGAAAVVGFAIGGIVPQDRRTFWVDLGLLAIGAAIVVAVTSLPVVGGWIGLVVVIAAVGGLSIVRRDAWRTRRGGPPEPMAPIGG